MAIRYDGTGDMAPGDVLNVARQTLLYGRDTHQWSFSTFHPDETRFVVSTTHGLDLVNASTGTAAPLTTQRFTHPEFSPDGTWLAVALVTNSETQNDGGSIQRLRFDGTSNSVSAPETLVPAQGSMANNFYPAIAPDGQWVLFNSAPSGRSYDNMHAQLWMLDVSEAGRAPFRLMQPDNTVQMYNSWPKWAPYAATETHVDVAPETIMWFTFSSKRAFGVRSPGGALNPPQLWMAPFFPERARRGEPASAPAFRLPFQDLAAGNHTAQWTEEVVELL